jgi:hypothetical protein
MLQSNKYVDKGHSVLKLGQNAGEVGYKKNSNKGPLKILTL